ncbi:MAG: hypothetical protein KDB07_13835 [Planctomycetes bacterium]|nr:hypothetical protein [Planctomycetota bacterium]
MSTDASSIREPLEHAIRLCFQSLDLADDVEIEVIGDASDAPRAIATLPLGGDRGLWLECRVLDDVSAKGICFALSKGGTITGNNIDDGACEIANIVGGYMRPNLEAEFGKLALGVAKSGFRASDSQSQLLGLQCRGEGFAVEFFVGSGLNPATS